MKNSHIVIIQILSRNAIVVAVIFANLWLFSGCSGGVAAPKPRKKLPEFSSFSDFNRSLSFSGSASHYAGLPFGGTELEFFANGKFSRYTYISMSDAKSDSLVMNLVNTYKPFAIPMLNEWSRENKSGVLVDFRTTAGAAYSSTELNLENPGTFSFPVIFVYDGYSASRASWFLETLEDMPMLKVSAIEGAHQLISKTGSYNCF